MLMMSYNIVEKDQLQEVLRICDIVRFNSAWFGSEDLRKSLKSVTKPRFLDIHLNRSKGKIHQHDFNELIDLANNYGVEWIGISKVESRDFVEEIRGGIDNGVTKVCAKIESKIGVDNIDDIVLGCDGIMVDKEDLATDVGSGQLALEYSHKVNAFCKTINIPTFELYGIIFKFSANAKKKVVYTYGTFDLLHSGHIRLLERAKALGDVLVVGVVSDEAVKKLKGEDRPIQPFKERIRIIEALGCVDLVSEQQDYDPTPNLVEINPDILTKGDDWDYIPGQDWIKEHGKEFVRLSYSADVSTSQIVKRIRS